MAIGYYRLSGYWYIFREHAADYGPIREHDALRGDFFVDGTTFDQVVDLYEFDRRLRLIVLDGIERVEVALRMRLGYVLGETGAFAHLDPAALEPSFTGFDEHRPIESRSHWLGSEHVKWLSRVRAEEDRSREDFVAHFKARYGLPLPIWVVTELLTFGSLVTLVRGTKRLQKNSIAELFGVFDADCDGDGAALVSWIANLAYVRNICAHHGRLWNRNMVEQLGRLDGVPDLAHAAGPAPKSRIYSSLAVLAFLTAQLDPASTWRRQAFELVTVDFRKLGLPDSHLGCPKGWAAEALWSPSYVPPADPLSKEQRDTLRHFECMSTAEVGLVVDTSDVPKRRASAVRYLRSRDELIGLRVGGTYRFPSFQLDVDGGQVHPVVRRINVVLKANARPWEAAGWWITANPGIGGAMPVALVRSPDASLIAAAEIVDSTGMRTTAGAFLS
ncbi:Abi family protein [Nocardia asteroides]|uniref:Abi family protein n=1 Tax=Nocardia asteroides TaxID=1824 RepID=UPI00031830CF|nr:Abi family protein [Nocardia asteroides]UGT48860.1 Abi family protein [Nocardia asteroides]